MRRLGSRRYARTVSAGLAVLIGGMLTAPTGAMADEGGVSFWLPGLFGSLAAAPQEPGWQVTAMNYYDAVRAGGDVALARDIEIKGFTAKLNANINANLNSHIDLGLLIPSYVFAHPILGGQATVSMLTVVGNVDTTLQGQIAGTLGPFGFSKFGSITDDVTAAGDLIPIFSLRWNEGVNNFMTYVTGTFRSGNMIAQAWRIPVSGTMRSTAAPPTPISIRRLDTNFPRSQASPTTTSIRIPTIRMASTSISTGECRNFFPSRC
jgi:hypothetical protein